MRIARRAEVSQAIVDSRFALPDERDAYTYVNWERRDHS
jgi:hypothetical protein